MTSVFLCRNLGGVDHRNLKPRREADKCMSRRLGDRLRIVITLVIYIQEIQIAEG